MQTISILLADDDANIRRCLRLAVEADPRLQICWEAENGLQALCLAKQHRPNLVLMDAQMPRMDGIEATRCLRQCQHHLPILIMSVYEQAREQALEAGASGFVIKDCGCEAIRQAITNLIDENEQQQ
jgi:two-component system response regulator DegU